MVMPTGTRRPDGMCVCVSRTDGDGGSVVCRYVSGLMPVGGRMPQGNAVSHVN